MAFAVRDLIAGRPKPSTASPDEPALAALSRMRAADFSQLPVVDHASGRAIGMLTYSSILRAIGILGCAVSDLTTRAAMENGPDEYQPDDDLFGLLDDLAESYAVLIVDADRKLVGIVTSYDATEFFRRRSEALLRVEDIEGSIKEAIASAFPGEDESAKRELEQFVADRINDRSQKKRT